MEAGGQSDRETRYIAPTIVRNPAIDSKLMRVRVCELVCDASVAFVFRRSLGLPLRAPVSYLCRPFFLLASINHCVLAL